MIATETLYRVICDGCGEPCDHAMYSQQDALTMARVQGWQADANGALCSDCWHKAEDEKANSATPGEPPDCPSREGS